MRAVFQYRCGNATRQRLERLAAGRVELEIVDPADRQAFLEALGGAEVLLHVLDPVTSEVMAVAPALRLIQKIGVGVNTIDLDAARARGIQVANMPGTNSQAVAEHTLALMLAALRRIADLDRETRAGRGWLSDVEACDTFSEIHGSTVGLVGFGEIPRRLAPILRAMGARVLYTARTPKTGTSAEACTLSEIWERSDIVSLHLPLTPQTRHIVDADAIARMKPGVVFVNTARGGLVDEQALVAALRRGKIAAAGLDVLAVEPATDPGHPLFALDNVVLTPHIAWLTRQTLARSFEVALDNCARLAQERPLLHRVA